MMPSKLFLERNEKIEKTINFKNDSPTTCYAGGATPAGHMGITMAEFANNPDKNVETTIAYINEINELAPIDCLNMSGGGFINVILSTLWLSKINMPGRELPENSLWQVSEKKVMENEDYDLILDKGYPALQQKILPKVLDMSELGEFMDYSQKFGQINAEKHISAGYPSVNTAAFSPPFEILCGGRSMNQFFMDCYKMPDKVKAAQDAMMPAIIGDMLNIMKATHGKACWVGGWRGASALVSPKIWNNLVWPYMKEMGMALVENGFTPCFHLDQNWDRDIERFLEIPEKMSILNLDGMTDMRNARKVLGDHVALMGDVPSQLLATGTPETVYKYVTDLIDDIGYKGLFITPGCDAPANAKFENMVAMFKAAKEYK
ncbi:MULTISPECIES: uroporphyrinogen decarboxylase family protein [unclassified Dehalobacter]|jgi:Uroporphyrinogen-III decarboxylase|uniref:uroporphyrinogen decarboxylase family protein n=1 Tax=unclassified Dehalobacter TaxID=2635733 RepID=UPI00028B0D19|nr:MULTISPECIES: uroporphyrinogen decarboxylase family protein [unclassified Dehalobacter]AFV02186.1 Uroporphyrinogen-III decarboxylase [Dehalobacter sp. DCA]AFV05231.1 Uroporphyrinogen-III decarboxylase [Dehalobacter sp. CF]